MPQPWANLSAKFQDVIDLLTAQNAKLDALQETLDYGLLTQATPPAPRIPYLLQVRMMLEEVKAALVGTGTDPTDIRTAIWGLAGPAPGTTLTDLYQILEDYKDTVGDRGSGMTLYNMLDSMYINTSGLLQDTDAINAAIGGVPHQSLEIASVRGLLNALRLCACEGNDGPPLTGDDAICASPYRSIGMVVVPWSLIGGTSVIFAVFPTPPPAGLAFGSTFGIGEDYAELECADWSAYRVWITSDAAQFALDSSGSRYNTNQWVRLSGSGSRSFSVESRYALQATICPIPPPSEYSVFIGGWWIGSPIGEEETVNGVIYACDENDNCEIIWQGPETIIKTSEDGEHENVTVPIPPCHHIQYSVYTSANSLNFAVIQGEENVYQTDLSEPRSGDYVLE